MVDQRIAALASLGEKLTQVAPAGKKIFSGVPAFLEGLKVAHANGHSPAAIAKMVKADLKGAGLPTLTGDDVADLLGIAKQAKPRGKTAADPA